MSSIQFSSVFIPRVSSWITEPMIQNTFWKNMLGFVSRVDFVSKMDNANRTIEDLAGQLQDREPHLVQLRTITEQFNNSVRSLHNIAEEFRYSADQYRAVNDAHRSDQ